MTLSYTLHLKLAVPDFLSEPWHAEFAAAMDSIDRAFYEGIIVQGASLWLNSTVYAIGDMAISPENGSIYVCSVAHTSSPAPQTFTQELLDHPTFWAALATAQLASQSEAEVGVENSHYMSPLRTKQAIAAQIGGSGTLLAFTSSAGLPASPHKGDFWYDLTTGILSAYIDDGNTLQWVAINSGSSGGFGLGVEPQGRLTLQTGVPVMTTTQSAKTTLYYTPYTGNQIPLWTGLGFGAITFTELAALTTDTTKNPTAIGASKVNDWFVWNDAGTLRLSHGVDWTNDTTRAVSLNRVSGIWVNGANITNGPLAGAGTYVGTTRSNASSQLDWILPGVSASGTAGVFAVWNAYNRVDVAAFVGDSTTSWSYAVAAWRAANNSATIRISFVRGLDEGSFVAQYNGMARAGAGPQTPAVGVGLDSTTAFVGTTAATQDVVGIPTIIGMYSGLPGIGYHFVSAIENAGAAVASTYWGSVFSYVQTGMHIRTRM